MSIGRKLLDDPRTVEIAIADLRISDSPRRSRENRAHSVLLAESGGRFPPIAVNRRTMTVIDGVHRVAAAKIRGERTIPAVFFDGDDRDAFVLSVWLNVTHGLPLSLAERKESAERILREYPDWSDRYVASVSGISDKTVAAIRRRSTAEIPQSAIRIARNGVSHRADVPEGRMRAAELLEREPGAAARQIAVAAGISATTVKDVRRRLQRGEDPVPRRNHGASGAGIATSSPATDENRCGAVEVDVVAMLERLGRDPAVRQTAAGRRLLRTLELCFGAEQNWGPAVAGLPEYQLPRVAKVVRTLGESWVRFADGLGDK